MLFRVLDRTHAVSGGGAAGARKLLNIGSKSGGDHPFVGLWTLDSEARDLEID